jgi:hypothetical protein
MHYEIAGIAKPTALTEVHDVTSSGVLYLCISTKMAVPLSEPEKWRAMRLLA